jgi:hypothetical protein
LIGATFALSASVGFAATPAQPGSLHQSLPEAPKAASQDATSDPTKTGEKKICRNIEAGFSHRTERVCMTAKQWEEYDRGD